MIFLLHFDFFKDMDGFIMSIFLLLFVSFCFFQPTQSAEREIITRNNILQPLSSEKEIPEEIYLVIGQNADTTTKIALISLSKKIRGDYIKILFQEPDKYIYSEARKTIWYRCLNQEAKNNVNNINFPKELKELREKQYQEMIKNQPEAYWNDNDFCNVHHHLPEIDGNILTRQKLHQQGRHKRRH